eukprot:COSAG05_NODE_396_length_10336_cov_233.199863_12_plen_75_part_00
MGVYEAIDRIVILSIMHILVFTLYNILKVWELYNEVVTGAKMLQLWLVSLYILHVRDGQPVRSGFLQITYSCIL